MLKLVQNILRQEQAAVGDPEVQNLIIMVPIVLKLLKEY